MTRQGDSKAAIEKNPWSTLPLPAMVVRNNGRDAVPGLCSCFSRECPPAIFYVYIDEDDCVRTTDTPYEKGYKCHETEGGIAYKQSDIHQKRYGIDDITMRVSEMFRNG